MYLTYEEYLNMGGTLDEAAFDNYLIDSEMLIDWYTFNRLHEETEIPERVKQCVFKLISLAGMKSKSLVLGREVDRTGNASVSAQSNDGVSISYNTVSASDIFDSLSAKKQGGQIENLVQMYLQGVVNSLGRKLLYRGLYPNE